MPNYPITMHGLPIAGLAAGRPTNASAGCFYVSADTPAVEFYSGTAWLLIFSGSAVNAGSSGVAGTISVFPTTASKGKTTFTATANSGNTTTNINTAAQAAARTYTIPDAGGNANFLLSGQTQAANGMFATALNLMDARNSDGSVIAAAASAGKFGLSVTLATSAAMISESANNNAKTDVALFEYVLPPNYIAAQNLTITANLSITGSGTLTVKTVEFKVYRAATNGTQGANIGPGTTSTITAGGADVTAAVTGTTLNPGDKIWISVTVALTETASSGMVANVNSIRIG